ncbi:MAG: endolytic transglycosylase MltG [Acidobacteriota bacterium]
MRRWLVAAAALALVALAGFGFAGYRAWASLEEPYPEGPAEPVTVDILPGTSGTAILRTLQSQGVIRDARLARLYLIHILEDPSLQAGEYRFERPSTTKQVLDQIIRGSVVTYPVTIIEGLTFQETAEQLAAQGFGRLEVFEELVTDPALIIDLDPAAENLEGYLYPDTYSFPRGTPEDEIVRAMVQAFRLRWTEEVVPLLGQGAAVREVREVVTLASIIEKEAKLQEERALISSVYNNRLEIGMGLYADPTIIYAMKIAGTWDGNIRRRDLKMESPYNTYLVPGLPPSPIGSPALRSLIAAVQPEDSPYLFFVSRNDGSHVFAQSIDEHNRNVRIWQKEFWTKKWAEERAKKGTK